MYKKMIEEAKALGLTSEKTMWENIEDVQELLTGLKETHPQEYWYFIRKTHGVLFKGHYTEEFALHDVKHLKYTDEKGEKHEGPHWTVDEVEAATKGMNFPSGVNRWDKYVAFNASWADWCRKQNAEKVLETGFLFYFADEDWDNPSTKVWSYFCCKYRK
jgi:hypothetical protein